MIFESASFQSPKVQCGGLQSKDNLNSIPFISKPERDCFSLCLGQIKAIFYIWLERVSSEYEVYDL